MPAIADCSLRADVLAVPPRCPAGEKLTVEAPDTSGWTRVSNSSGQTGIVPTSYIEVRAGAPPLTRRPTGASARSASSSANGGSAAYGTVEAIYAYTAGSNAELSISKGETLELTAKGKDFAAGWTEVVQNGRKGIVPTSYVR